MKIKQIIQQKPRLSGIAIGGIVVFPMVFLFYSGEMMMSTLFVLLLFLDWFLQKENVYTSKTIRFIVSIASGYGMVSILVMQTIFMIQWFTR